MPTIPLISAERRLPNAIDLTSEIVPRQRAIAGVAGEFAQLGEQLQRIEDTEDDIKVAEYATGVSKRINSIIKDGTLREPFQLADKYDQLQKELNNEIKQVKGSPRLRAKSQIALQGLLRSNDDNYQSRFNTLRVESARASVENIKIDMFAEVQRGERDPNVAALAYRDLLSRGAHTPSEQIKFQRDFETQLAEDLIYRDYSEYFLRREAGNYNHLNRFELDAKANSAISNEHTAHEQTQSAIKQGIAEIILNAGSKKQLNTPEMREMIERTLTTQMLTPATLSTAQKLQDGDFTQGTLDTPNLNLLVEAETLAFGEVRAGENEVMKVSKALNIIEGMIHKGIMGKLLDSGDYQLLSVQRRISSKRESILNRGIRTEVVDYTRDRAAFEALFESTAGIEFFDFVRKQNKFDRAKLMDKFLSAPDRNRFLEEMRIQRQGKGSAPAVTGQGGFKRPSEMVESPQGQ